MADRNGTLGARTAKGQTRTLAAARQPSKEYRCVKELLDRQPPCNVEIERELIGSLFLVGTAVAFETLEPDDFYEPWNAFLFGELRAAHRAGVPFNTEGALLEWIKRRGTVHRFRKEYGNSFAYNVAVGMERGLAANVGYYCQVIKELSRRRKAMQYAVEMLSLAHDDGTSADEWKAAAAKRLSEI